MAKNKIAQNTRREVRRYVIDQYTILNEVLKGCPKYVPLWLWSRCSRIFIDTAKLEDFMQNGVAPKDVRLAEEMAKINAENK